MTDPEMVTTAVAVAAALAGSILGWCLATDRAEHDGKAEAHALRRDLKRAMKALLQIDRTAREAYLADPANPLAAQVLDEVGQAQADTETTLSLEPRRPR